MSNAEKLSSAIAPPDLVPGASLRGWLDHLQRTDRLAIAREGMALRFQLAAIAKRLDGRKATFFPKPDGHPVSVVSGLVSDRGWIAEAMGVGENQLLEKFQQAALNPVPWREVKTAPVQKHVHRTVDLAKLLPLPTHNELDYGPYITAGLAITRNPATGVQNAPFTGCSSAARTASARCCCSGPRSITSRCSADGQGPADRHRGRRRSATS